MGNSIILPSLPLDIIAFIGEKCCQIDSLFAIKFWQVSKKLREKPNLQRYYLIAKRLLLQKFLGDNFSSKTFSSQIKNPTVLIVGKDKDIYIHPREADDWLFSTIILTRYIFDGKNSLNIRKDLNNFTEPFAVIRVGAPITRFTEEMTDNDFIVKKIEWQHGKFYPKIKIYL
jgi:hypothetical protein